VIEIKKVSPMNFNNIEMFKNRVILQPGFMKASRNTFVLMALSCLLLISYCSQTVMASDDSTYVSTKKESGKFILTEAGHSTPLVVSSQDFSGVIRVAKHLQTDIGKVTDALPILSIDKIPDSKEIVLIGTIGKSPLIDGLVRENKLDLSQITGKWESSLIQVVKKPLPTVDHALVITGSDKRGTIYGMYDLSAGIGVSPWYWWADVPVKKKSNIYISPGPHVLGEPAVKYRGIFINDEAPALSGWAYEKFGGFNHKFYEHVFELILRLKGNFLWPAMWGRAFYDDDPENPKLANEYGIVISTSHHEPMMRAHVEWQRYGSGPWDYARNEEKLRAFWTEGIKRMDDYESIVTLAMRGDGDEPMSEEANISLLEKIVKDQREIIAEITGKNVESIPQVWALYKEVQEYYDKGMRVPDDVTLLLCDDNWGNIRKLPKLEDNPRSGGYGIYYHFDYVGGPRNYKWLNTNQISRIWEQMHLAYEYGADRIWVVNVGDIKPMEFPISFFLDYAWNPEKIPAEMLPPYTRQWAEKQFGKEHSLEIAHILTEYTRYNSRRKPELLAPDTYSLTNYREAERIVADYNNLYLKANSIYESIPAEYKDAFYQLVLHPVEACANLNELYVTTGKNRLYAKQGRAATNSLANIVKKLFQKDIDITNYYNNEMAGGKWSHMMDQTHIGYTYWQQPDENTMPEVEEITISVEPDMGIAIEGSDKWWPEEKSEAVLPVFDPYHQQTCYIEVFNRGKTPFDYSVKIEEPWIIIDEKKGIIEDEKRLWVSVDWANTPSSNHQVPITFCGPNNNYVVVKAVIFNPASQKRDEINGFVESNGYISIEAEHFSQTVEKHPIAWQVIPDLGRTLSAVIPIPVTAPVQNPGGDSPRLEYQIYLFTPGLVNVKTYLSPTLNFHNNQGLRFAVSIDDKPVQIINIHENKTFQDWEESVRTNTIVEISKHTVNEPGEHILNIWMIDPGIVLQKMVIEIEEIAPSYLGPPESFNKNMN